MKRSIAFLTAIALVFCLSSCRKAGGEEYNGDGGDDNRYLFTNWGYGDGMTFCRINVETGTISPACPDPLCRHDKDQCPFYMIGAKKLCGRYIYYMRASKTDFGVVFKRFCRFDLESGEYHVLYEAVLYDAVYGAGNYIQFCIIETENGESGYIPMLLDRAAGTITRLTDDPLPIPQQLYAEKDGRLYWQNEAGDCYSTDRSFENRIDGDKGFSDTVTYDGTALSLEFTGEIKGAQGAELPMYKLSLYDFSDCSTKVIFEETPAFPFLYRDKILFFKLCEDPPLLGYEKEINDGEETGNLIKVYETHGGKLYICDRDGSNERLLIDITGTDFKYSVIPMLDEKTGADNWVGVVLYSYERLEDGTLARGTNRLMLVNIVTGECKLALED